jgi:hypothetical protein
VAASRLNEADRQADKSGSKERAVISKRENTLFVSQHFNNLQKAVYGKFKEKDRRQACPTHQARELDWYPAN